MIISIASDHGGYLLKEHIKVYLEKKGISFIDNGTNSQKSVDYPVYAKKVALDILEKRADRGILVCGTGIGISIVANRFKGIRCALVHSVEYTKLCREHNDANIIALGGRFTTLTESEKIIDAFIETTFAEGRHKNRVFQMDEDS